MNIEQELARYAKYCPLEKLMDATRLPVAWCPEPITAILPSLIMGVDGPTLDNLVLISDNYICEVRLGGRDFDYSGKRTITNYRINLSQHEVTGSDQQKKIFETALVEFSHSFGRTRISFAGDGRDEWIKTLHSAIPISILLECIR